MCSNTMLFSYCKHSLMKQHLDQLQTVVECNQMHLLKYYSEEQL